MVGFSFVYDAENNKHTQKKDEKSTYTRTQINVSEIPFGLSMRKSNQRNALNSMKEQERT